MKIDVFESKINKRWRIVFIISGLIFSSFNYFLNGTCLSVTQYAIMGSKDILNQASLIDTDVAHVIVYNIGAFVIYCMIGGSVFIFVGEAFIRICDLFNIKSKFYKAIVKTKDLTTLSDLDYIDKYKLELQNNNKIGSHGKDIECGN